jgi:SAM-dependent methyltransferase
MQQILPVLQQAVDRLKPGERLTFEVPNPDKVMESACFALGYKGWVGLAELLGCRMLTPRLIGDLEVALTFEKLTPDSFHDHAPEDKREKYGAGSRFFAIEKMAQPTFLYYFLEALRHVRIESRVRILDLGIHRGDEFVAIREMVDSNVYKAMELVGIDHSYSAIKAARKQLPESQVRLLCEDIRKLDNLDLGRFDLILSISTLQSPEIGFKPFLMQLIQQHLDRERGAVILGFPNCRWVDGEMLYGAKAPNYTMSELSLVLGDVMFAKKYLQQHKFRVMVTGREYLFVTATRIGRSTQAPYLRRRP